MKQFRVRLVMPALLLQQAAQARSVDHTIGYFLPCFRSDVSRQYHMPNPIQSITQQLMGETGNGQPAAPSFALISALQHNISILELANGLVACVVLQAAVLGNHDLDFGLDNFEELAQQCNFPWLLANVLDNSTGEGTT